MPFISRISSRENHPSEVTSRKGGKVSSSLSSLYNILGSAVSGFLCAFRIQTKPVLTHLPQGHNLRNADSQSLGNTSNILYNWGLVSGAARTCPECLLSWEKADSQESQRHLCTYGQIIPDHPWAPGST